MTHTQGVKISKGAKGGGGYEQLSSHRVQSGHSLKLTLKIIKLQIKQNLGLGCFY